MAPSVPTDANIHLARNVRRDAMTERGPPADVVGEEARVEETVAARIAPSPEFLARVEHVRTELVRRVEAAARERKSPIVRALVAGSAARGTFLTDRLDIDLFLLFPPDFPRERLREEGLALGRAVLTDPETRYAEHPYLRGHFEGFQVDAVPGFAIDDPSHPISAVDRTPFHQAYLAARETPELVREVRLAKQFFRSVGVYGSEAKTEGFSGYLLELLVVRFGSLRELLLAARRWRIPVRLAEPGKEPPRLPANVALILPDPVDPNRNVASALSRRNLGLLVLAAGAYLDQPSATWFEVRASPALSCDQALALVRERGTHVTVVSLPRPDLVDDTLYPQIRKAARAIADELDRSGFPVMDTAIAADPERVFVLLEVAHARRSAVRQHDGPPAGIDRVGQFLAKWTDPRAAVLKGPYVREDGSLAVETRRTEREPEPVLRAAMPRLALGKDLTPTDPARVSVHPLTEVPDSPPLRDALTDLLAKRLPWLDRG
jgi:tRNA nucleotidyltransferase (CCA-adding enzyme)